MLESIKDWLAGEIEMPSRAGSGTVEAGVAFVAKAVEAEKECERKRTEGRHPVDDSRTRSYKTRFPVGMADREGGGEPRVFGGSGRSRPNLKAKVLSFPARLLTYVREKCDGVGKVAYTRAGVSRQIYSRIISWDDTGADKTTVMKFCIGLQLDMFEAELLMKSAGYAFSGTIPFDQAFVYAIEHRMWNIHDVNELLVRNGLPDLGLRS